MVKGTCSTASRNEAARPSNPNAFQTVNSGSKRGRTYKRLCPSDNNPFVKRRFVSYDPDDLMVDQVQVKKLPANVVQFDDSSDDMEIDVVQVVLRRVNPRWQRKVSAFGEEFHPSRSMDDLHPTNGAAHCHNSLAKECAEVESLRDAIQAHAYRRVNISFYQLLAYWEEGCLVQQAKTTHQHGTSECRNCSAAHSALLPNLEDDFFAVLVEDIRDHGVDAYMERKLYALGLSTASVEKIKVEGIPRGKVMEVFSELSPAAQDSLLSPETHLFHVMNSTMKLPELVNRFDTVIESALRPVLVKWINRVSQEDMHPYEALQGFMGEFWEFFREARRQTEEKLELAIEVQKLEERFAEIREQLVQDSKADDPSGLLAEYLLTAHKLREGLDRMRELRGHSLHQNPEKHWRRDQKRALRSALNLIPPHTEDVKAAIATVTSDPRRSQVLLNRAGNAAARYAPWKLYNWARYQHILEQSAYILELQSEGSYVPDLSLLAGKVVEGRRVAMTDEELREEKLRVISHQYSVIYS